MKKSVETNISEIILVLVDKNLNSPTNKCK